MKLFEEAREGSVIKKMDNLAKYPLRLGAGFAKMLYCNANVSRQKCKSPLGIASPECVQAITREPSH
jgi:hypothetical protein